jgi:hypothetical protein
MEKMNPAALEGIDGDYFLTNLDDFYDAKLDEILPATENDTLEGNDEEQMKLT